MSAMYAIYHGQEGLKRISERVHGFAALFAFYANTFASKVSKSDEIFDTVCFELNSDILQT